MKEFTLDPNSWHFKLANFLSCRVSKYDVKYGTDICTYTRAVLGGLVVFSILTIIVLAFSIWTGNSLYQFYNFYVYGIEISESARAFGGMIFVASFMAIATAITVLGVWTTQTILEKRRRNAPAVVEPSFVSLAYSKFKDKTCYKVNFKVKEQNESSNQ